MDTANTREILYNIMSRISQQQQQLCTQYTDEH